MDSFTPEELYNLFAKLLSTPIFSVKNTPITLVSIFILVVILSGIVYLSKFIKKVLLNKIFPRAQLEIGTQYTLARLSQYLIIIVGSILRFNLLGLT